MCFDAPARLCIQKQLQHSFHTKRTMNWLAHLLLSEPTPHFRIGNLLPDLLNHRELQAVHSRFKSGIDCHRLIDRFTDSHPVVRRSRERFGPTYRRFSGILVDIFYDHFLAQTWSSYSEISLEA